MVLRLKQIIMENSENYLDLSNYYGTIGLLIMDGKYYLALDDHSSSSRLEIDKVTYSNLMKFLDVKSEKY